ncbi:MAG: choice-of-anchor P family protein [Acidimicrobiales bacterium]
MINRPRRWAALTAVLVAVVVQASPAAASLDVNSVSSGATGVAVTGDLGVIPPTPTVSLTADEASPPAALGPFTDSAPSAAVTPPNPFVTFTSGPLTVATVAENVAGPDGTGRVEAEAEAEDVLLGPGPSIPPGFPFPVVATASSIFSSCTADANGATGTTVITDGVLNGAPFPPTPTPAPNTVIPVAGVGTITLNEQVVTKGVGPGGNSTRLVVTAVHADFEVAGGGVVPSDVTADAVIGQVVCESVVADEVVPPGSPQPPVPPVTTAPPAVSGALAATGSAGVLPLGLLALGLGVALRWAIRPRRDGSVPHPSAR